MFHHSQHLSSLSPAEESKRQKNTSSFSGKKKCKCGKKRSPTAVCVDIPDMWRHMGTFLQSKKIESALSNWDLWEQTHYSSSCQFASVMTTPGPQWRFRATVMFPFFSACIMNGCPARDSLPRQGKGAKQEGFFIENVFICLEIPVEWMQCSSRRKLCRSTSIDKWLRVTRDQLLWVYIHKVAREKRSPTGVTVTKTARCLVFIFWWGVSCGAKH